METLGFRSNCEQGGMAVQSDTDLKSERCKTSTEGSAYPTINSRVVSGQRLQGDLEKFRGRRGP